MSRSIKVDCCPTRCPCARVIGAALWCFPLLLVCARAPRCGLSAVAPPHCVPLFRIASLAALGSVH
eukprot:6188095-Lingulodinium_polyedra.AAC.1